MGKISGKKVTVGKVLNDKVASKFSDGIKNIYNDLANTRSASAQNRIISTRIGYDELNAIYKLGIGSKIIRIKAGYSLRNTLQFSSIKEAEYYKANLEKNVKRATGFMLAFGRGIIVLYNKNDDLSYPITKDFDPKKVKMKVFSGDMVTAVSPSMDLMDDRYFKPEYYSVRGKQFHYSRVIDFSYYEPVEKDKPQYQYGGISEFELIYNQIVSDSIVERATPTILEKNSSLIYKVFGFKEAMQDGREADMVSYFRLVENARSIYGAGLLDAEDTVESIDQTLTNLKEADEITLRRLAMVTSIPVSVLVGENVRGLNSTGKEEATFFQNMIEALQSDYIEDPLNQLFARLGMKPVSFKENQGRSPEARIEYEAKAIDNALKLYTMGEDYSKYLEKNDIIEKDNYENFFFPEVEEDKEDKEEENTKEEGVEDGE